MNSKQKEQMNTAIYRIANCKELEKYIKNKFPNYPLVEYKFYDKNLAMRVMFNNVKSGEGTGNCLKETILYYLKHFNIDGKEYINSNSALCKGNVLDASGNIIFHCWICFQSEGGLYYLTHSNGEHKVVPFHTQIDNILSVKVASFKTKMNKNTAEICWEDYCVRDKILVPCVKKSCNSRRVKTKNRLFSKLLKRKNKK